jgi:UMF1 family MFS transporter
MEIQACAGAASAARRERRCWYFYDFANSAFASTVLTLFLGPWLTALAKNAAGTDGLIHPFGIPVDPRSYWSYLVSLSVITQVICLPIAGSFADRTPNKKRMLGLLAYAGAFATMAMYWLEGTRYLAGGFLFLLANLAFGASIVVYNSFLNDIALEAERDAVSSRGWGLGYLGGGLLLALNLVLYSGASRFGISEGLAVRISLSSAGAWWALFSMIPLAGLRNRRPPNSAVSSDVREAFVQLWRTMRGMAGYPQTLLFLAAYLVYNDAIQAVITLAGQFGADYLKIPMGLLTLAILMVQFVAFAGSFLFNWVASRTGAKNAVSLALALWILLMAGVFFVKTAAHYFVAAALVALIMGGSQALSRSLFSLMIPKGREAEYYSLYEISDKGTSWLAPLLFGVTLQLTGSYQYAILSMLVFFVAGLTLLLRVNVPQAAAEAGNALSRSISPNL